MFIGVIWLKWIKVGKSGEMFIGQFEHTVDEKNRIAIPSKYRGFFKEGAVITRGLDGCLFMFTRSKFSKMAQTIGELPLSKSSARLYARLILASAQEVYFDSQGRILIPGYLVKHSSLKREALIMGLYDRVEIWSKETWDKQQARSDKKAEDLIENLSELGV